MTAQLRPSRIAAGFLAFSAASLMGAGIAQAAITDSTIPQPSIAGVDLAGALPQQRAMNGNSSAEAHDAIALGVSASGGHAVANAQNYSGPAAIAIGPDAHAEAWGVKPGLAMALAGPNSTVRVSGSDIAQCEGQWGFAGDFQTPTGCVVYTTADGTSVKVPLDSRPLFGGLAQ